MSRLLTFLERYLDPGEQLGQVLFGLIMALTVTLGAATIVSEGEDATRDMLRGILGCNAAWGIIQGWMYVIDCVFERSRNARLIRLTQEAPDEEQALAVLRTGFDSQLDEVTTEAGRTGLYRDIHSKFKNAALPYYGVTWHDVYGGIVVFVLVTATTLPAIVPFLLIGDLKLALRVSNLLMILMLFAVGFRWAGRTNTNRWTAGLFVMLGGIVMVGVAEALGG